MVTIKDIAQELGFSHSVVSRALNPNPDSNARVSPQTRQLIESKAQSMGYQPNRIAEFMKRGRSAAIGVFLPEYSNRLIADLVIGISEAANKHGFPINLYFGLSYASYSAFIKKNIKNTSSGIISYSYNIEEDRSTDALIHEYISVGGKAILLNAAPNSHLPVLYMDEKHGSLCAAECLLQKNCACYLVSNGFKPRADFFMEYITKKGLPCKSFELENFNNTFNPAVAPTGIFATTDQEALCVIKYLKTTGAQLGRDVFIVGYDDLELTGMFDPPLTTIHQPFRAQGFRAVEKLINLIYGNDEPDEAVIPYLVKRDTA
ncbi:MAG: LacI family DNA-binding transcriptional regulator [Victivallaceae bacterium]